MVVIMCCLSWTALADDHIQARNSTAVHIASLHEVEITKSYAMGVHRFNLDTHTELIGWRISNAWYFGRQDGLDSGLTLVWQKSENQLSLSKDGVRITRRF